MALPGLVFVGEREKIYHLMISLFSIMCEASSSAGLTEGG